MWRWLWRDEPMLFWLLVFTIVGFAGAIGYGIYIGQHPRICQRVRYYECWHKHEGKVVCEDCVQWGPRQ